MDLWVEMTILGSEAVCERTWSCAASEYTELVEEQCDICRIEVTGAIRSVSFYPKPLEAGDTAYLLCYDCLVSMNRVSIASSNISIDKRTVIEQYTTHMRTYDAYIQANSKQTA